MPARGSVRRTRTRLETADGVSRRLNASFPKLERGHVAQSRDTPPGRGPSTGLPTGMSGFGRVRRLSSKLLPLHPPYILPPRGPLGLLFGTAAMLSRQNGSCAALKRCWRQRLLSHRPYSSKVRGHSPRFWSAYSCSAD